MQNARSAMSELNLKASVIEEQLGATEIRVAAQRQSGAITEIEAMAKLSVVRTNAAGQLTEIADQMMAVAQASGDPRMVVNVEAFRAKIEQLAASADVVGSKFRLIFEDNLTNFFTDLVSGAKSFKDAFKDMVLSFVQGLARMAAEALAQQAIQSIGGEPVGPFGNGGAFGASGRMFAKGAAFALPGIMAFANGGAFTNSIVDSPTLFAFGQGGQFGVMGEAGPEAIMPLTRGPGGRLGVEARGGGALSVAIGFDASVGGLTAMVRDEAGRVVAKAAPGIVGKSVQAVRKGNAASKTYLGT